MKKVVFFAFILSLNCLFISNLQGAAYGGGSGSIEDPYQISTIANWQELMGTSEDWSKSFVLINDIDFAGTTISSIGSASWVAFSGIFNGQNHVLRNVIINEPADNCCGIFGYVNGEIRNLGVESTTVTGQHQVGILCGENAGAIINCHTTGYVNGVSSVGGIIGMNYYDSIVIHCHSTAVVTYGHHVGGLCGWNFGSIAHCYAAGTTSGSEEAIGGLCGTNSGTIYFCYATGSVTGDSYVGGLCGDNSGSIGFCYAIDTVTGHEYVGGLAGGNQYGRISQCYATGPIIGEYSIGGLCGENGGEITTSFWDIDTTGQTISAGGTGKTMVEMQALSTFTDAGWDFVDETANGINDYWQINSNNYPQLTTHDWTPTGDGTSKNPYVINNIEQLSKIWMEPYAFYCLGSNLDLSGIVWASSVIPLFLGSFDGREFTISNFVINRPDIDCVAFFGNIDSSGQIQNLTIKNINITGHDYVGGLCGYNNYGSFNNCHTTGSINGNSRVGGLCGMNWQGIISYCSSTNTINAASGVGGLLGLNMSSTILQSYAVGEIIGSGSSVGGLCGGNREGTVTLCYATGSVSGNSNVGGLCGGNDLGDIEQCYATGMVTGYGDFIGGLCGDNRNQSTISYSYATGDVMGEGDYVGGLCGSHTGYSGYFVCCYARGNVIGNGSYVGGLCGNNDSWISGCYATGMVSGINNYIGGLCGNNNRQINADCFWNIETSGQINSDGGIGKATAEMMTLSTFTDAGWDFSNTDGNVAIWTMMENDYPHLNWEIKTTVPDVTGWLESDAATTLAEMGLSVEITGIVSDTIPAGQVISQSLTAGTEISYGLAINLVMSLGSKYLGNGTETDPYKISTKYELLILSQIPTDYASHFIIMADIDLSGKTYTSAVIAPNSTETTFFNGTAFTGIFNGNGHVISNLNISTTTGNYIGLFGNVGSGGQISDIGLKDVKITGYSDVGGLAGYNRGYISQCYSIGAITGNGRVGGLCGCNSGTINQSYTTSTVAGVSAVGGLCGYNYLSATINQSYATGAVTGNSYIGGLCGYNSGTIITSFWDIQTSGTTTSAGGTGKTTAEMQTQSTFTLAGWDFVDESANGTNDIWWMPNHDYPRLYPLLGTADNPYQIWTAEQLDNIGNNPNDWDKHFKLMADIDMSDYSGTKYHIIGNSTTKFTGSFDGNGHVIHNLSYSTDVTTDSIGLFGRIENAVIKNLILDNVYFSSGSGNVGGLVGWNDSGMLSRCTVRGGIQGTGHVGGLVGRNNSGVLTSCRAEVWINGTTIIGGLVGGNYSGSIENSYAVGAVNGAGNYIGGLTGFNSKGTLLACYAAGEFGDTGAYVGGVAGWNSAGSTVDDCFWDMQVSGKSLGVGGGLANGITGKTTAKMQMVSTFMDAGWDFAGEVANGMVDVWRMCMNGVGYPRLSWEFGRRGDFSCPEGINIEDLNYYSGYWLIKDCTVDNNYCSGADLNYSGVVDLADFAIFSENWLIEI